MALRRVVADIAKRKKDASGGEGVDPVALRIAQRRSISLHAENARAILQLALVPAERPMSVEGADWRDEETDEST
jgi:hypothetical protein